MKKYLTINTLVWAVTLLTSLMLLMSGVQKIAGSEEMVNNFTSTHLLPYLFLVGLMEVATASLLVTISDQTNFKKFKKLNPTIKWGFLFDIYK